MQSVARARPSCPSADPASAASPGTRICSLANATRAHRDRHPLVPRKGAVYGRYVVCTGGAIKSVTPAVKVVVP